MGTAGPGTPALHSSSETRNLIQRFTIHMDRRNIHPFSTMASSSATVFIPDPFHPAAEVYAEGRFKRVLRPGQDDLDRAACLAASDGIRALRIPDTPLDTNPDVQFSAWGNYRPRT
jgi:hypothetical protein